MVIDTASGDLPLVCRLPLTADRKDESFQMYRDWIQFLEETWDQQLAIVLSPRRSKYCIGSRDEPLSYPVTYGLGEWVATTLPSLPWVSNEDPEVLKELGDCEMQLPLLSKSTSLCESGVCRTINYAKPWVASILSVIEDGMEEAVDPEEVLEEMDVGV
ncbi:hypothetical protein CPC08DRAFT_747403 [Agrocybe pediades]|nr:hypothetical protein CPC08DRAFT_747403 [Agrocybe pediades]